MINGSIMRKNIDISKEAIKLLTLEAVKQDTCFKIFAEKILEDYAKKLVKNSDKANKV